MMSAAALAGDGASRSERDGERRHAREKAADKMLQHHHPIGARRRQSLRDYALRGSASRPCDSSARLQRYRRPVRPVHAYFRDGGVCYPNVMLLTKTNEIPDGTEVAYV
jgi:hypothetical protein